MSKFTRGQSMLRSKRHRQLVAVVTAIILIISTILFWQLWLKPEKILPVTIEKQINFVAILPTSKDIVKVNKNSIKYEKKSNILSVLVTYKGQTITITEQAYPDILVYEKLVGTLKQYDEIQTKIGKVALTRPDAAGGSQVGVVNVNNQTLVFAKATKDLTKDEWKQFFNELSVVD